MKKTVLLGVVILCMVFTVSAKITWVYDMQTAKASALAENKMIMIDFWATWCGPCKKMESEFWSTSKADAFKDKLIFVKADVDLQTRLATQYGVRGIPYIVITDIAGNKVWDIVGYQGASVISKVLESVPKNVVQINKAELPFIKGKETEVDFVNAGKAYAEAGKALANRELKKKFLGMSSQLFKKVKKGDLATEAQLRVLLNKVYMGQTKNIEKKMKKISGNEELKKFILDCVKKEE